jgi:arylformamidase
MRRGLYQRKRKSFMPAAPEISLDEFPDLKEVYDISAPLCLSPGFPGDRAYLQEWMAGSDEGEFCSLSAISMSSHFATHLDFPGHIRPAGRSQSSYSLSRFIIPAQVVSVCGVGPIPASCLDRSRIGKGQALLFKTENSRRRLMSQPSFSRDYVFLSDEAARLCVSCEAGLVGIDYLSVDGLDDESLPVHRILLASDVLILEGLDLSGVSAGRYLLVCLPLSIEGAEASPVRAALLRWPA